MKALSRSATAILAAAMLLAAACGGGGNSQPRTQEPPPPPSGGITRTGAVVTVGSITGFGSVIVNGIEYDTSGATFTKDGLPATQDDFAVGHVVLVKGTISDDNTNAVASTVEFDDNVEGPVSSVDAVTGTIVIIGQTVRIVATTSIDDSCPDTLEDLLLVPAVEVSGLPDADGVIESTRIECRAVAGNFEVSGTVSDHNPAAMTFSINALVVDYSSAQVDNFPNGMISDGDPVEAIGSELGANDELKASRVEFKGNQFAKNEGDHIEIEGFITRYMSPQDFDISGVPATTLTTTNFEGGDETNLGLNLKIEADGEFDAAGKLNITKLQIKASTAVRVAGVLDSVTGNTLVIMGITINTDPLKTRFEDKSSLKTDPLGAGDLAAGQYMEVRGQELPEGQITAVIAERDDARPDTRLRGFVEAGGAMRPDLKVFGVTIQTTTGTVFKDVNDVPYANADDFWAAVAAGSLVDARGAETADQVLAADEVQLESQ